MKKTYISPVSKVVKIRVAQVMATSQPGVKMGSGSIGAASVDSREDNSWDIWGNDDYED